MSSLTGDQSSKARTSDEVLQIAGGTTASTPEISRVSAEQDGREFSVDEKEKTVISQRPVAPPSEFLHSLPLAELARMLEDKQLDHFLVQQLIGGGGMGAVFRGRDLRLDRTVAIKVIPTAHRDADAFRRFRMEAQSAARLDHPNIARVYYIGQAQDWNYIVFEHIEGINLRDLVEMEGPLGIDDAVYYTRQVAEALQHAQQRDVVHRDIKPSNVLITPAGIAKVVDMGLARSAALERSSADLTASGVTLGTFDYISPEQAKNPRDADVRSDLYSLGCTLFFMLTGRPPFPDGTALQKLLNHGSQPPPDPRQWRDDLSDQLNAVLMKLIAKRPLDRYQRPNDLINDLLLVAESEHLVRSQTPGTFVFAAAPAERSIWERNIPWMVAFASLLGIAFWLKSAEFTDSFELPLPAYSTLESIGDQGLEQNSQLPMTSVSMETSESDPASPAAKNLTSVVSELSNSENSPLKLVSPSTKTVEPIDQILPADTANSVSGAVALPTREARGPSPTPATIASGLESRGTIKDLRDNPGSPAPSSFSPQTETRVPDSITASGANGPDIAIVPDGGSLRQSTGREQAKSPELIQQDTLVVASHEPPAPDPQWCGSLSEAIARASENEEIRFIEIRDKIMQRGRLSVPRAGLVICAAPGKTAEIEFVSTSFYSSSSAECLIDVGRHDLRLERVALVAQVPTDEILRNFSVFNLLSGGQLELEDCQLTVIDRTGSGDVRAIGVTPADPFIDEFALDEFAVEEDHDSADSEPVSVHLRSCFARGQMSLLGVDSAVRVEVAVDESLLAIGEWIVDLEGASKVASPAVRMSLKDSSIAGGRGFCRIRLTELPQGAVCLNRTAQSTVFWTTSGLPHILVEGPLQAEQIEKFILLKGEDNAYDQGNEVLVQSRATNGEITNFNFSDAVETWYRERGNENFVRWQNHFPPAVPFHEHRKADYRLRESMFMPGLNVPPPPSETGN